MAGLLPRADRSRLRRREPDSEGRLAPTQDPRARGVRDRAALARLDIRTARLVADGVNVTEMQSLIEDLPAETPVADLSAVIRSKKQLTALQDAGIRTFGDLEALPADTATYSDAGLSTLPEQIDLARAALGPEPIYRRRDVENIDVPRADIEVDIDMESIESGVYMWGTAAHRSNRRDSFADVQSIRDLGTPRRRGRGRQFAALLGVAHRTQRGRSARRPLVPCLLLQRLRRKHLPLPAWIGGRASSTKSQPS